MYAVTDRQRAACESKDAYRSASEARAFAVMRGQRMRAYRCNVCHLYHLTRRLER